MSESWSAEAAGERESAAHMNENRKHHISGAQPPPQPKAKFTVKSSVSPHSLQEGARWKQFAHYAFIEAQPFITFIPWLCPNESQEQG